MNAESLLETHCNRYSFDSKIMHDLSHVAVISDKDRNDLINDPNRNIDNDSIELDKAAVGFRAEILASVYFDTLFDSSYEDINCEINHTKNDNKNSLDRNIITYNENHQSDDTDFCNGNKFRNRMRLQEVKIRIDELNEAPPVPIEQTKCYNVPTDEDIEYHFKRALKLKEKINIAGGKYFYEMTEDEIIKLPISIFDGLDLDAKEQPSTVTTDQQKSQTVQVPQNTNHQSPTTNN